MTLKGVDGTAIRLSLLKRPIPLESLEYEKTEESTNKDHIGVMTEKRDDKTINQPEKILKTQSLSVMLLKEPISLDSIGRNSQNSENDSSVTVIVKTVQGRYGYGKARKRPNEVEQTMLRQNVMTLLEHSTVYPFLYISNKFQCFVCSESFTDSNLLKRHTNDHSLSEYERELGNKARDKTVKVDVDTLQCKVCCMAASDLLTLKQHLKNDHDKNIAPEFQDNIIPFRLGEKTYECQICHAIFLKLRLLIIHMSQHFNNYSCEVCGAMFITHSLLKRHLQIHEGGNFPCNRCDKVFNTSSKRSGHIRGVHLKQKPRRCPKCPETFNSNYQRTKHLRIVHNDTPGLYKCETCGREYDMKYHLQVHIRSVHLQEKNHECPVCRARFFAKDCMHRHMIVHTGEKNFKCPTCGKAYARLKNLKEHTRTHELGPAICTICGECRCEHTNLPRHNINDSRRNM